MERWRTTSLQRFACSRILNRDDFYKSMRWACVANFSTTQLPGRERTDNDRTHGTYMFWDAKTGIGSWNDYQQVNPVRRLFWEISLIAYQSVSIEGRAWSETGEMTFISGYPLIQIPQSVSVSELLVVDAHQTWWQDQKLKLPPTA